MGDFRNLWKKVAVIDPRNVEIFPEKLNFNYALLRWLDMALHNKQDWLFDSTIIL
jgi:hypothetical protein